MNYKWYQINHTFYESVKETICKNTTTTTPRYIDMMTMYNKGVNESSINCFYVPNKRLGSLGSVISNEIYTPYLDKIFPGIATANNTMDFDFSMVVSAAMRSLFRVPSGNLTTIIDSAVRIIGLEPTKFFSKDIIKIGVHIRTNRLEALPTKISLNMVHCFSEKIGEIVDNIDENKTIVIFHTSDLFKTQKLFLSNLNVTRDFIFMDTEDYKDELNLTLKHIDRINMDSIDNSTQIWSQIAKTFVDWVLLQHMDFMVLSRSGFSETAVMLSQKPTWRVRHEASLRTDDDNECVIDEFGGIDMELGW